MRRHIASTARACAIAGAVALLVAPRLAHAQKAGDPSSEAPAPGDPAQILLFPLAGELPGEMAEVPALLTKILATAIRAKHAEPVLAQIDPADVAALTGCPPEATDCFDMMAAAMDVSEVVHGTVAPAQSGTGIDVTLTSIRPNEVPWQRVVHLEAQTAEAATMEFEPKAHAFLRRGEEPPPPDLTVKEPPPPPPSKKPLDMSNFSLKRVKPYAWGLTGGGLVLFGAGVYALMKAGDKQDELDDARDQTVSDLERMKELEDEGKRLTAWGNGLLITGAVVAIAGATLGAKQALTRPEPRKDAQPKVDLAPLALRGGAGLTVIIRGDL